MTQNPSTEIPDFEYENSIHSFLMPFDPTMIPDLGYEIPDQFSLISVDLSKIQVHLICLKLEGI